MGMTPDLSEKEREGDFVNRLRVSRSGNMNDQARDRLKGRVLKKTTGKEEHWGSGNSLEQENLLGICNKDSSTTNRNTKTDIGAQPEDQKSKAVTGS